MDETFWFVYVPFCLFVGVVISIIGMANSGRKLEIENEQLWEFHELVLKYWMWPATDAPSDKEIYNAITALDAYKRSSE